MSNEKLKGIRGLLFDYGGTLDTDARHWAHVLWESYRKADIPVTEAEFREAYVFGERALARNPIIRPEDNFLVLLQKKIDLEFQALCEAEVWQSNKTERTQKAEAVAQYCYAYARRTAKESLNVLTRLRKHYPMVLVSNFYGNLSTILHDFGLADCFSHVVESAVVGVRKPDPAIFTLGVEALEIPADEILVIGDSYDKDVLPGRTAGCHTVWFKGEGWTEKEWDESLPDAVITSLPELLTLLLPTD